MILFVISCKKDTKVDTRTNPGTTDSSRNLPHSDISKIRLINSFFLPGNYEKKGKDTFYLQFNKAVNLNYIVFNSEGCLPDLEHTITSDSTIIKFYNFLCGGIGGAYPFKFSVSDSLGNVLIDTVTFYCYKRNIPLQGNPINYFITDDNQYCWVLTNSPNQLLCLGINDTSYKKSYDLDFVPTKAIFNYYNNKIYIIPSGDDLIHRDYIYVFNPALGKVDKKILIPHEASTDKEQFAYDLAFGSNGYGMAVVTNDNSYETWLVIDSKLNDSLYTHPMLDPMGTYLGSYSMCFTNYNKTQILALEVGARSRLGVLDCFSHSLTEFSTPVSPLCYSEYFVANKIKNDIFMVNLQTDLDGQFVISNGEITGTATNFDAYNNSEAEFSYRANENNYIYYLDNSVIGIVDYTTGKTLMSTNFSYDLSKISATTDGKYILAKGTNCIKIFDTQMFYQNF